MKLVKFLFLFLYFWENVLFQSFTQSLSQKKSLIEPKYTGKWHKAYSFKPLTRFYQKIPFCCRTWMAPVSFQSDADSGSMWLCGCTHRGDTSHLAELRSPQAQGYTGCLLLSPTWIFSSSFNLTNIDKCLWFATTCQWVKWKTRRSVCPPRYTWVGGERDTKIDSFPTKCGGKGRRLWVLGEGAEPAWDLGRQFWRRWSLK